MNYLIGCTHINHDNIIKLCKRPFENVVDMNSYIVKEINSLDVQDTLFLLGDTVWNNYENEFWSQIKRKCVVLFGNHCNRNWYINNLGKYSFVGCYDYLEIPIDQPGYKGKIVLSHYPMEVWNGKHKGWFMAYSHCHSDLPTDLGLRRLHVGADTIGFKPISIPDFIRKIESRNLAAIEREAHNASN